MFRLIARLAWWIKVALLLAFVSVFYFVFTFVQVFLDSRQDDRAQTDAIVVLGAAQYDGRPSPVLAARLDHAFELWEEKVAEIIVVTGGGAQGDRFTEASAGAAYLHDKGVPDSAILRETSGRSSWESLAAAERFLKSDGIESVTLVSDPYHAKRIKGIASELGLEAHLSSAQDSPVSGATFVRRLVSETFRVGAARFIGYRRLTKAQRVGELVPGLAILLPVVFTDRHRRRRQQHLFGGGVIGNTAGSDPVIEGSSPSPRANVRLTVMGCGWVGFLF